MPRHFDANNQTHAHRGGIVKFHVQSISQTDKHQMECHEKSGGESSGILPSTPGNVRYAAGRIKNEEGVVTLRDYTQTRYLQIVIDKPRPTDFLPQRVFPVYNILIFSL